MTIPLERTNAVVYTEQFLYDLLDPKKTPRVPKAIRERALHCLRHYPTKLDMETIAKREDDNTSSHPIVYKVFGQGVF